MKQAGEHAMHRSLERGLRLVETVALNGGSTSLAEAARRTGLHRSTAHHLLQTLVGLGYLRQDPDTRAYELAAKPFQLETSLEALPAAWREQAFEQRGRLWCLREQMRRDVEFARQDLLAALPEREFDLVLCRNLAFTYFDAAGARRAVFRRSPLSTSS